MLYYKTFTHPDHAEWVVLVHGAGGSSNIWFKQLKSYRDNFNVLLIDLRGHGKSNVLAKALQHVRYSFTQICEDIIEVINHLNINKAHFVGISMGTILIRIISEKWPDRVLTMVMGGAIIRMNHRSRVLVALGNATKRFIPYMWLYKLFAWIIMPRKRHAESRKLFAHEAKQLCQKEFIKWFKLTYELTPLLKWFREKEVPIPTLYIMGDEDYMFLPAVRKVVEKHKKAILQVIHNCGHVVNIEQPMTFNNLTIAFMRSPNSYMAV